MRKVIAIILCLMGILLVSYPKIKVMYSSYKQQQIIESWKDSMNNLQQTDGSEENTAAQNGGSQGKKNSTGEYISKNMEGMLSIKKIKLNLPILKGATKRNLDISVCSLENTGKPGDTGNYCLAAHRSHSYGILFNRLDELEKGDEIIITADKKTFTYVVYEKLVVAPDDTKPLEAVKNQSIISLITCDYSTTPWRRIVVHAKLK